MANASDDPVRARLEAFCARHVPARLHHVPGILARRLWQLNRDELWPGLQDDEYERTYLRPGSALRCITLLTHEYSAEGQLGSLDVTAWELSYRYYRGLPDTMRTLALNGHVELLEAIATQNRTRHENECRYLEPHEVKSMAIPIALTETDVDAVARLAGHLKDTTMLRVVYRHVPEVFSPFALQVLNASTAETECDQETSRVANCDLVHVNVDACPDPTNTTCSVFHDVLTNPELLASIGAFQFDIHKWINEVQPLYQIPNGKCIDDVVGILPRLAIIQGDEFVLRRLYRLSILPKYSNIPKFSFVNAMHDAATEGHLRMLQWLHTLRPRLSCRPDTMAMTVRSGWADVVEWLCEHARESASLSMTDAPVCDAARWGFVDVLRVLHEHGDDAWFSSRVMDSAAASGQLAVVQWLHTNRSEGCTTKAMDDAADMNHLEVVKWLHANRTEGCSKEAMAGPLCDGRVEIVEWLLANRREGCKDSDLAYAIASGDERRLAVAMCIWGRFRDDSEMRRGVALGFRHACAKGCTVDYILLLIDVFGSAVDVETGIIAASRSQTPEIVEILGPMVRPQVAVQAGVNCNLPIAIIEACRRPGSDLDTPFLIESLRDAIRRSKEAAVLAFVELGVDRACPNALALAVKFLSLATITRLHPQRPRAATLEALPEAQSEPIARFLLENESEGFTDSYLLENLPTCAAPYYLRHILRHRVRRRRETERVVFSRSDGEDDSMHADSLRSLSLAELSAVATMEDPELDAFISRHHTTVIRPSVHLKAAADGNVELMKYVHARGVAPTASAFDPAIGRAHASVVEWLLSLGLEMPPSWRRVLRQQPTHPVALVLLSVSGRVMKTEAGG